MRRVFRGRAAYHDALMAIKDQTNFCMRKTGEAEYEVALNDKQAAPEAHSLPTPSTENGRGEESQ